MRIIETTTPMISYDELAIVRRRPAPRSPATWPTTLSCYDLPAFWRGAAAVRDVTDVDLSYDGRRLNAEMADAIAECERTAGRRDLSALPAYYRWLGPREAHSPGIVEPRFGGVPFE